MLCSLVVAGLVLVVVGVRVDVVVVVVGRVVKGTGDLVVVMEAVDLLVVVVFVVGGVVVVEVVKEEEAEVTRRRVVVLVDVEVVVEVVVEEEQEEGGVMVTVTAGAVVETVMSTVSVRVIKLVVAERQLLGVELRGVTVVVEVADRKIDGSTVVELVVATGSEVTLVGLVIPRRGFSGFRITTPADTARAAAAPGNVTVTPPATSADAM